MAVAVLKGCRADIRVDSERKLLTLTLGDFSIEMQPERARELAELLIGAARELEPPKRATLFAIRDFTMKPPRR